MYIEAGLRNKWGTESEWENEFHVWEGRPNYPSNFFVFLMLRFNVGKQLISRTIYSYSPVSTTTKTKYQSVLCCIQLCDTLASHQIAWAKSFWHQQINGCSCSKPPRAKQPIDQLISPSTTFYYSRRSSPKTKLYPIAIRFSWGIITWCPKAL